LETQRDGAFYWDNVNHAFKQSSDDINETNISNEVLVEKKDFSNFLESFSAQDLKQSWSTDILTAELFFIWNAARYLKKDSLSSAFPNFLNFHFQSISLIESEFGFDSEEFNTAVILLDRVLDNILNDNFYSYELLFLPAIHHEETKKQLSLIGKLFPNLNLKNYPQIFLDHRTNDNGNQKSKICNKLREVLQGSSTLVFCLFSQSEASSHQKRDYFENTDTPTPEITPQQFFGPVEALHMYLWIFLFLIVVLLYTVYMLVGIEVDAGLSATSSYVQKNPRK